MQKIEYEQLLEDTAQFNIDYILTLLRETMWYLIDEDKKKKFTEHCFQFLENNIDKIEKEKLIEMMSQFSHVKINNHDLFRKLMEKTIEYEKILITQYNGDLNLFDKESKIKYIKLLNDIDYQYFSDIYYVFKKEDKHFMTEVYREIYYQGEYVVNSSSEKIIPCNKFNELIMNKELALFLDNELIDESSKITLFKEYLSEDNRGYKYISVLNMIKKNQVNIFNNNNVVEVLLMKLFYPHKDVNEKDINRKNNIILFFDVFNNNELLENTLQYILSSPIIKEGLISVFKEKISLSVNNEIKNFSVSSNYKNINLLQYIMFNKFNNLMTQLCNKDEQFMRLFNNSIHEDISGFNYERSPLDLALKGFIANSFIENLYIYKLNNNQLKPVIKDKVAAMLFKSFKECKLSETTRYTTLLNAVSLIPTNIFNKYFNYHKELLSTEKCNAIEVVKNMLNLSKKLEVNSPPLIKKLKI